ncbi:MAG: LysR family transcriptional regulator [Sedimenticola sp.]
MKKNDYLSLDGNSLQVFVAVLEESSVSKAAKRLGVTQSAVSHTLEKLRIVLNDPLFVRSGRSIVATERALGLLNPVQEVLEGLRGLTETKDFDPTTAELEFTVAANDCQRALIFPKLVRILNERSINIRYSYIQSKIPDASLLRDGKCDLVITPFPPEGDDIFQTRLFSDKWMCFFDGSMRDAPTTKSDFLDANHLDVVFEDGGSVLQAMSSELRLGELPGVKITVPNFNSVTEFILGSDLVIVGLGRLGDTCLKDLNRAELPFKMEPVNMYMVWQRRTNQDPASVWLRGLIKDVVA